MVQKHQTKNTLIQQNWGFLQQPRVKLFPLRDTSSTSNLLHRPNSAYYKKFLSFFLMYLKPIEQLSVKYNSPQHWDFCLYLISRTQTNTLNTFELGPISYCPAPVTQQKEAGASPKAWISSLARLPCLSCKSKAQASLLDPQDEHEGTSKRWILAIAEDKAEQHLTCWTGQSINS